MSFNGDMEGIHGILSLVIRVEQHLPSSFFELAFVAC